jgi:hypothetical protein
MLIVLTMRATEPIRQRCRNHRRKFSSNIPSEAMRGLNLRAD